MSSTRLRYFDIAVNLTDPMFRGIYRGQQKHVDDFEAVLERAVKAGVDVLMVTGTDLETSQASIRLALNPQAAGLAMTATVGCHPTNCAQINFENENAYFLAFDELIGANKTVISPETGLPRKLVAAIGECGLDYNRLSFCDKDTQKKYFERHFELSDTHKLPFFFHCRNSSKDFIEIVQRNRARFTTGVVHSYDGSYEDAMACIGLGLYIGINGCSLRSEENLETVRRLPLDKLMVETDAPWCEIRPTHASFPYLHHSKPLPGAQAKDPKKWAPGLAVRGRNEPAAVDQIVEVIANLKGLPVDEVACQVYKTSCAIFA